MQQSVAEVAYYHVELAAHDVILAGGLPCESYLDSGNRRAFADPDIGAALLPPIGHLWEAHLSRSRPAASRSGS